MKFFYVALVVVGIVIGAVAEDGKLIQQAIADCNKEQKLTPDEIEMIKADRHHAKEFGAHPKSIQCYPLCIQKKIGFIDANDKMMEKVVLDGLTSYYNGDQKIAATKMEKCREPKGSDMCEKAFNYEVCIHKA